MNHETVAVLSNQEIAPRVFEMILQTPNFSVGKPGQFVMLYPQNAGTLLPRPISICRQTKNITMLVYKVFGGGTRYLSTLKQGDNLPIMAPLGNNFSAKSHKKVALVGGGVGIPPMVFLYDTLQETSPNTEIDVFLGFKDTHFLTTMFTNANLYIVSENVDALNAFQNASGNVYPKNGNVLTLLNNYAQQYDEIYACGPKPMLQALCEYAKQKNIPLQVSLEERMACGVGACVCCVANTTSGYVKICCDGPVFDSDKVVF
ncbi:MAG: dihydroorotate dehydrogenase electron transfer subunit [Defluviitaleaceae bacterium]|nr:dihydroorotate dehydrogenase electron transfer subunit [Defluviitaleaceae bacterium]